MPYIKIELTTGNGNTTSVVYAVSTLDAFPLFDELRDIAWASSAYMTESSDQLSREASYFEEGQR